MPAPTPDSLLDRVDEADRPVGLVRRSDVFLPGVGFRVAHVFVFNRRNELLLQQVGSQRLRSPLRWGSSVACYLHAGEDYATAAMRRLQEELGVSPPIEKLGSTRMPDRSALKFIELFRAVADTVHIGEPRHIEALRFHSLSEIERLLSEEPGYFTETFPYVYRLFRAVSST